MEFISLPLSFVAQMMKYWLNINDLVTFNAVMATKKYQMKQREVYKLPFLK